LRVSTPNGCNGSRAPRASPDRSPSATYTSGTVGARDGPCWSKHFLGPKSSTRAPERSSKRFAQKWALAGCNVGASKRSRVGSRYARHAFDGNDAAILIGSSTTRGVREIHALVRSRDFPYGRAVRSLIQCTPRKKGLPRSRFVRQSLLALPSPPSFLGRGGKQETAWIRIDRFLTRHRVRNDTSQAMAGSFDAALSIWICIPSLRITAAGHLP